MSCHRGQGKSSSPPEQSSKEQEKKMGERSAISHLSFVPPPSFRRRKSISHRFAFIHLMLSSNKNIEVFFVISNPLLLSSKSSSLSEKHLDESRQLRE